MASAVDNPDREGCLEGESMAPSEAHASRRRVLGGSIASLGAVPLLGAPAAADPPAEGATPPAASLPLLQPGERSVYFGPIGWSAFYGGTGSSVIAETGSGSAASIGYLGQSLALDSGSHLTAMEATFRSTGTVSATVWLTRCTPDTSPSWGWIGTVQATAPGTKLQPLSHTMTVDAAYALQVYTGPGTRLLGVRVRYRPPAPSGLNFVPITPARVYDSRRNMAPDASGKMTAGTNRTVSIAHGRSVSTGAVTTVNAVPATAKAIAYTLTVTGTSGGGYLAVNPGGDATVRASTINWLSGQTLANSGIVGVSPARTITIISGGGSADVIVDVTGYFRE